MGKSGQSDAGAVAGRPKGSMKVMTTIESGVNPASHRTVADYDRKAKAFMWTYAADPLAA
jgi:hypothetical protein